MFSDNEMWWFGFSSAALAVLILLIVIWHDAESNCQELHNVADCEWSRTPFTPVILEDTE